MSPPPVYDENSNNIIMRQGPAGSTQQEESSLSCSAASLLTVNQSTENSQIPKATASSSPRKRRGTNYQWSRRPRKKTTTKSSSPSPPLSPKVVMTKRELSAWTKWYKTPDTLEQYLRQQAHDPAGLLQHCYAVLAQIMFHMFDAQFYDTCYSEMYCWEYQSTQGCETTDKEEEENFDFDQGAKLILRIKVKEAWEPYIYIARSAYGGLGIFTARAFPQGGLLGLYMGPLVWQANSVGTDAPSDEYLETQGVQSSPCLCSIRDNHGRMAVYNPERIEPGNYPAPLYLGMHYMKGVEEKGVPATKSNCAIVEDGGVVAHFALPENTELICGVRVE